MIRVRLVSSALMIPGALGLAPICVADPFESFSGTAVCDGERFALTLNLSRGPGLDPAEFEDPCRSGSGPCNDMFRRRFEATRIATGEAYISRLTKDGSFMATQYTLSGTAADIPPKGWNRQFPMRYEYRLESADAPEPKDHIALELLRYKDIYDHQEKTSLKIGNTVCEQTDMIYRRLYAAELSDQ